jgi:hypothetical protein
LQFWLPAGAPNGAPIRCNWDKGDLAIVGRTYAVADLRFVRFAGFPAWLVWAGVHIYFLIGFANRLHWEGLNSREMITAYAILKKGAANANFSGKRLDKKRHDLIVQVCDEILAGQHHDMFPLHV